jgi:hypothetical protein
MNMESLSKLLSQSVETLGTERIEEILREALDAHENQSNSLTIIANSGMHEIPNRFIHGELYIASSGNLNFDTKESITEEYKKILVDLKKKLLEKEWKRVYLVPTGHVTLALQIKLLIYHVLRIGSIDLFYSKGDYHELEIGHRSLE